MAHTDDGGPAFPVAAYESADAFGGMKVWPQPGMTLRDWFAGQALVGFMAFGYDRLPMGETPETIARQCYEHADACLAERAKASGK